MLQALQRAGNGERKLSKESRTSCETCTYYIYDEEYECYLCDKNMDEDGLDLEVNGDFISAKGTTLGGDDGIAVAYALAILDDDSIAHPYSYHNQVSSRIPYPYVPEVL